MTDRDDIREELSPLLDGELPPQEQAAVEAELHQNADLAAELEDFQRLDALYRQLPAPSAPPDLEAKVLAALEPEVVHFPRRKLTRRRLWPALAAAAMLTLVIGGVVLNTQLRQRAAEKTASLAKGAKAAPNQRIEMAKTTGEESKYMMPLSASPTTAQAEPEVAQVEMDAVEEAAPSLRRIVVGGEVKVRGEFDKQLDAVAQRQGQPLTASESAGATDDVSINGAWVDRDKVETKEKLPARAMGATRGSPLAKAASAPPVEAEGEAPKATAAEDAEESPERKTVANREFVLRDKTWYQADYEDQEFTPLARGSDALEALVADRPEIKPILELGDWVVFSLGESWYLVGPG